MEPAMHGQRQDDALKAAHVAAEEDLHEDDSVHVIIDLTGSDSGSDSDNENGKNGSNCKNGKTDHGDHDDAGAKEADDETGVSEIGRDDLASTAPGVNFDTYFDWTAPASDAPSPRRPSTQSSSSSASAILFDSIERFYESPPSAVSTPPQSCRKRSRDEFCYSDGDENVLPAEDEVDVMAEVKETVIDEHANRKSDRDHGHDVIVIDDDEAEGDAGITRDASKNTIYTSEVYDGVFDDAFLDTMSLDDLLALVHQSNKAAEAAHAASIGTSASTPPSATVLTQNIALDPPVRYNLTYTRALVKRLESLEAIEVSVSHVMNAKGFPLLVTSQDEPMCMTPVKQPSLPVTSPILPPPRALRLHPHALDGAVSDGDHLLVHRREWDADRGGYKGTPRHSHRRTWISALDYYDGSAPKSKPVTGLPRGPVSCQWTRRLSSEEERLLESFRTRATRGAQAQYSDFVLSNSAAYTDQTMPDGRPLTLEEQMAKPYLSYHGITLTHDDVHVLRNDWLTDNNISFWEEYLENEVLPRYPQARISLLRPAFGLILMTTKIEAAREALPKFKDITHIFFPISDAALGDHMGSRRSDAGSHWSLLLISIVDGVAFHYDSLSSSNLRVARNVTARMAVLLGRPLRFRDIDDTPQQANGNDCGVFVCVLMRFLLVKRLLNAHAREKVSMSLGGKMIDAQGGRQEMLRIIENLRHEAVRRRSASPLKKNKEVPRIE
ncbi:hypothetical protein HMPREF1624_07758 [Sporothrix schenckii ATCC 58251]|uniref:Ubiquitin-like protease family profile domain-containing protein n=1 Tax=Sporothrix schenckii (strain ATCC 58251 / de Perez 2211183) TaxID=1391915 RepID=U7PJ62_SPOS1|nr:hypothetical protein HMPREF1624_07758 [Sporothrix schenckii ATCC 58251]